MTYYSSHRRALPCPVETADRMADRFVGLTVAALLAVFAVPDIVAWMVVP